MTYDILDQKKYRLDQYRPFPQPFILNMKEWFRVELTYTSNALEGNTLTRQETALVVEKGLTVGGKKLREHLEATNHAEALDWLEDLLYQDSVPLFDEKNLLHLHHLILKGIDDKEAGLYRQVPVRISGSTVILPNPHKVPDLMQHFFQWLSEQQTLHPLEYAAEAHYRLVTIHPFVDGNGRTARLLMNFLLRKAGYPPALIPIEERLAYVTSLEKAQTGGSRADYLTLICRAVERSLDIYLEALQST